MKFKLNILNILKKIDEKNKKFQNNEMNSLMKKIAIIMKSSVMKNFQLQGTDKEKWKPLSPITIANRRKGKGKASPKILMDTGYLRNSIFPIVYENKAMLVTNTDYAPTHQFGAKKGQFGIFDVLIKSHKRKDKTGRKTILVREHRRRVRLPFGDIPARPFMTLRQEHKQNIIDLIKGHFYGL